MLEKFRVIIVSLYLLLISAIICLAYLIRPFHYPWLQMTGRIFGKGGLWLLGIKIEGEGLELMEELPSSVVIGNHQHNMDVFIYSSFFPPNCVTVGKKSLIKIPFFGWLYYLSGQILIDRQNKKNAWSAMSQAATKLKDHNLTVMILPEGTRSKGRGLLPFKRGAFQLAKESNRPIIPIAVSDVYKNIDLNRWHAGTLKVKVLPAIGLEIVQMKTPEELAKLAHDHYLEALRHLNPIVA
ncbi:MAG: 1-acyl-sn-glycerol-3-phosphate acyltransferase [Bdellovibrio sp. CG12_big_fil_rev_8_21_14_0_65_39_13]|nr:MAG: 1-acyl-sn-glycerol-3-phosphate acyltransferase [Bdellovibrio sp. CG22_combo_CG10-13_8_21_14_all_39_27]PIQ60279.1 MAG: 1-acyl-sn-glycerol-3-phosphate acyltransferase [Bdellovibrio sp. CG12_big_fil_rev_8_21_14_0_65_39_13]PIR34715.1 MAG: 1-acyl-sn-glycerol-3-phosphate acyltransferase [Bdellovibrio sp. CG11_big_fil_rev_8_21_14_0_20_39_38]